VSPRPDVARDRQYRRQALSEIFQGIFPGPPPDEDPAEGVFDMIVAAAFVLCVREVVGDGGEEEAIRRTRIEYPLVDVDEKQVPAWMVEAYIRAALGEGRMIQGIDAVRKADVQLGFIYQFVTQPSLTDAKREELTEAGMALLEEMDQRSRQA
jgi:hypothetical protein